MNYVVWALRDKIRKLPRSVSATDEFYYIG